MIAGQVELIEDEGADVAEAHLREGPAVDEILDLAEEVGADLIVIGNRRQRLGSASTKVLHAAKGPILVHVHSDDVQ